MSGAASLVLVCTAAACGMFNLHPWPAPSVLANLAVLSGQLHCVHRQHLRGVLQLPERFSVALPWGGRCFADMRPQGLARVRNTLC